MSARRFALGALGAGSTLLAFACAESSTATPWDPLTKAEVSLLVITLISLVPPADLDVGEDGVNSRLDQTLPCEVSGTASFAGGFQGYHDAETDEGAIWRYGFIDLSECAFDIETGEMVLNGDPGVYVSVEHGDEGDLEYYQIEAHGGIEFETSDDRAGRCELRLTIQVVSAAGDLDEDVGGRACGVLAWDPEFKPG